MALEAGGGLGETRDPAAPNRGAGIRAAAVRTAGKTLIGFGVIVAVVGTVVILFSGAVAPGLGDFPPELDQGRVASARWSIVLLGVAILGIAGAYIASGRGVLRGRSWARYAGLAIGVAGAILWLSSALGTATTSTRFANGLVAAIHGATALVLLLAWPRPSGASPRPTTEGA